MKIGFTKEILHSTKKNEDFYVVRLVLFDNSNVLVKSRPLLWLTKEQYDSLNI